MPAPAPVSNGIRLVLNSNNTELAQPMVNIFHATIPGALTPTNLLTVAQNCYDEWTVAFKSLVNIRIQWTGVEAYALDGSEAKATYEPETDITGLAGGDTPVSVCAVISWDIPIAYRGGKPRTYISGVPTTSLESDAVLTSDAAADLAGAADAFRTEFNSDLVVGGAATLVNIAYKRNHVALPTPLVVPITSSRVNLRLGSQRRRLGRLQGYVTA